MMKLFDSFLRVAPASQADLIKPVTFCVITLDYREGRSVLYYHGIAAHEGLDTHSTELMNARVGSDIRSVGDLDVPCKGRGVCHDHVVAYGTIVRNMRLSHQQAIVANTCQAASARGSAMNGYKLTDVISLSNFDGCRFAAVFQVLRCEPDRDKGKYARLVADAGLAINNDVGFQTDTMAQGDLIADYAKGPYIMIGSKLSIFADNSTFVDEGGH
jgi:hypothetical protein